ncbi:glycoprotein 3-alpha-L-fucosyltransferase A-like [Saccostrea echinata]|uniref:glycoprotein 3-alpha-L-fucosyltransferase A-like n=1 Tax=Saccostrea echinata TaxID=191078 RepID=UPI002A83996D|nr:glycoprotein 3-alpha-L-fucosyltransferase A-like [Saccostrea echinata]
MNLYRLMIQNVNKESPPLRQYRTYWIKMEPYIANYLKLNNNSRCSVPNCILTDNISNADIVVFSHQHIPKSTLNKREGQIWVFYSAESPYHTHRPNKEWMDRFDLSMSYMDDSDIQESMYGEFKKRQTVLKRNYSGILINKTKDAVWVSSHCVTPSRRENLVKDLSKYLSVDTYGGCGTKKCGGQYDRLPKCQSLFEANYKYYFSFENSICKQYTTEKLRNLFLHSATLIPVINGPNDASRYIPKGTYINSQDFANASSLAKELKRIGSNEAEYIRYLTEKDKYTVQTVAEIVPITQCTLCKYLVDIEKGKKTRKSNSWFKILDPKVFCTVPKY